MVRAKAVATARLLRELKGAPLSVLFAFFAMDESLSRQDLLVLAAYSRPSVDAAKCYLLAQGYIHNIPGTDRFELTSASRQMLLSPSKVNILPTQGKTFTLDVRKEVNILPLHTEENPPSLREEEEEEEEGGLLKKVFALYEQEIGGTITPLMLDLFNEMLDQCSDYGRWKEVFVQSIGKRDRWAWIKKVILHPHAKPKSARRKDATYQRRDKQGNQSAQDRANDRARAELKRLGIT